MKSRFLTPLVTEELMGSVYARLYKPFKYYSEQLNYTIEIPAGFIFDYESVPILKGTSKRGGLIHDYLCRSDSNPIVTKKVAADIYLEAQTCRDLQIKRNIFTRFSLAFRRRFKTLTVRIAPGYFHKRKVLATIEEF